MQSIVDIYKTYLERTNDVQAAACLTLAEVVQAQTDQVENCAPILTVKEVAQRLRVSSKRVYELCADGDLPAFKVGRSLRVAVKALGKYTQSAKSVHIGSRQHRCL